MTALTAAELAVGALFVAAVLRRFVEVKVAVKVDRVRVGPRPGGSALDALRPIEVALERAVRRPLRWDRRSFEEPAGPAGERVRALQALGVESVEAGATVTAALPSGLRPDRALVEKIRAELEALADALDA